MSPHVPVHPTLESVAKLIKDLEQLVTLLREGLSKVALEAELSALRPQLQASLEATAQYRTQATTLQVLVDRMAPTATAPKISTRKKARPE